MWRHRIVSQPVQRAWPVFEHHSGPETTADHSRDRELFRASKHELVASAAAGRVVATMPGVKKVRFASPPVLSPMSHDELDDYEDYEAAEAAARAAYDDDETAAITARDEEPGSAYDDEAK